MSRGRRTDKEAVVHVHSGISLSYKKERVRVCFDEVDEPAVYYTELSKSEREDVLFISSKFSLHIFTQLLTYSSNIY